MRAIQRGSQAEVDAQMGLANTATRAYNMAMDEPVEAGRPINLTKLCEDADNVAGYLGELRCRLTGLLGRLNGIPPDTLDKTAGEPHPDGLIYSLDVAISRQRRELEHLDQLLAELARAL